MLEDYDPEREEDTCWIATNNTEDIAASRCTEDIANMMQEVMAEGINNMITRVDENLDKLDGKLTRKINEMEHKIEKITRKQEYHDGSIRRLNRK